MDIYYYAFSTYAASCVNEREFFPGLRAVKKHLKSNREFRVTTYRVALCVSIHWFDSAPTYDIYNSWGKRRRLLDWFSESIAKKCETFAGGRTPAEVSKTMCALLTASIGRGEKEAVGLEALREPARLKSIFNRYLRKRAILEAPLTKKIALLLKVPIKWILYHNGKMASWFIKRRMISQKR